MSMIQREVRVVTYEVAVDRWGPDPQTWPAWECPNCSQRNSGWALECGRCEAARCVTLSKRSAA